MSFGWPQVSVALHATFTLQANLPVVVQPAVPMLAIEVEDDEDPWRAAEIALWGAGPVALPADGDA